jgi:transcriptional regulator with XRE-family HTH domain
MAVTSGSAAQIVPFPRTCAEPSKSLLELRQERGWSLNGVAKAMMAAATDTERKSLPDQDSLKRSWRRWETGAVLPDGNRSEPFFRPIIARMFGVTPDDLFPPVIQARTAPEGVGDLRAELQARRSKVQEEISRLEGELSYLNAVLAVPVPAVSR